MCKENTIKNIDQYDKFYNVAIFIDYENVHKTLVRRYENAIRLGFFEKLKVWCKNNNRRIVKIAVYCNFDNKDLYESKHQSLLQSYGVETVHTSNQGKNYADLKLTIDVLNVMYTNNNIDEFIIMSNDKDMTPLLNTVRLNKRKASVLTTGDNYNSVLCEFADEQIKFEDIIETEYDGELHILEIENKFLADIKKFIEKRLEEEKDMRKKHYSLEYFIPTQSDYYNIMQYELINILSNYYNNEEIIFYKIKNGKIAILPVEYKEKFIEIGCFEESDILENYDIGEDLKNKYEQYW